MLYVYDFLYDPLGHYAPEMMETRSRFHLGVKYSDDTFTNFN